MCVFNCISCAEDWNGRVQGDLMEIGDDETHQQTHQMGCLSFVIWLHLITVMLKQKKIILANITV